MSRFRILHVLVMAFLVALTTAGVAAQRPVNPGKSNQAPGHVAKVEKTGITDAQMTNLRDRAAVVARILDKHENQAKSLGMPVDWRRPVFESLIQLPLGSLEAVEGAATLQELTVAAAAEAAEPQALGDVGADLVYTPIAPCRYIDTRYVAAGRISGNRGYDLANDGASYGGVAACDPMTLFGVTNDNTFGALAVNVTIVNPTLAPGYLAVKPTTTAPNSSWMNWYEKGVTVQAANMGILTPDRSGALDEFYIYTSVPTHVIMDVAGAFLRPEAAPLDVTTVSVDLDVAVAGMFNFTATCPVGRAVTGGGANYSGDSLYVDWWQSGPDVNAWRCRGWNQTGGAITVTCYALCGRIPGR